MRFTKVKTLSIIFFLFLPLFTTAVFPVSAQTSTTLSNTLPKFYDSRVRYADQWVTVTPVLWTNLADGKEYPLTGNYIQGIENSPDTKVTQSPIRLVGEEYLGSYRSSDGKDILCKEYTLEFDVCVYTVEDFSDYYGPVNDLAMQLPIYELDIYYLDWTVWKPDPTRSVHGEITFYGYDLTKARFDAAQQKKLQGDLILQVDVNTATWEDVFGSRGPLVFENGNWTYAGEVYSSVRDITVINTTYGRLEDNARPTIIKDSASAYDGDKGVTEEYSPPSSPGTNTGSYQVWGFYMSPPKYWERQTMYIAEGDSVGSRASTYFGQSLVDIVHWSNRGYDPDSTPADTVFFSSSYTLRPNQKLFQADHTYHYEKEGLRDWLCGAYFDRQHPRVAENRKVSNLTIGWEVLNYWVYNTFRIKVVIGAYHDWQPLESASNTILCPPTRETGNNTFPITMGGTSSGGAFMPAMQGLLAWLAGNWWLIIIVVVVVIVVVMIIRKGFGHGGGGNVKQAFQFYGQPPPQQQQWRE